MFAVNKWGALCLLVLCQGAFAAEPLWLSDVGPGNAGRGGGGHSHGGPERGSREKGLWLRVGGNLANADYVTADGLVEGALFEPGRKLSVLTPKSTEKGTQLSFPMTDEGFYNVYLTRQRVADGRLEVSVAKSELMNHSCRNGHDDAEGKVQLNAIDAMPLEIVRERQPKEDLHTRIGFGDQVAYRVLARGKPVSGVEVTLYTGTGWRNTAISDEEGVARFTMIRDYFPAWEEFDPRHRQDYLVVATVEKSESGTWGGTKYTGVRYTATLPGSYYPTSRDYTSYGYGLLIGLFAMVFTGVAVYIYRRRRVRPLREVRFDE